VLATVLIDTNSTALFVLAVSLLVCFLISNAFWLETDSVTMLHHIATPLSIFSICGLILCRPIHAILCLWNLCSSFLQNGKPIYAANLKAKPARFVGKRRHRHPKRRARAKGTGLCRFMHYLWLIFVYVILAWTFQLAWCISRKDRNKRMHAACGNGGPPKGKGRGKHAGKSSNAQAMPINEAVRPDSLEDIAAQVARVLPQAAVLRAQSELLQSEWDAEVRSHQSLDARGGISLVPKNAIPSVVQRVSYTTHPTAILICEQPDRVGLRGYPRKLVSLQLSAMGPDGQRQIVQVERYLVQMSYGEPVQQILSGVRVQMLTTTNTDGNQTSSASWMG